MLKNPYCKEIVRFDNKVTNIYNLSATGTNDFAEDIHKMNECLQGVINKQTCFEDALSCTSQKKKTYDAHYTWDKVISCKDFINFFTCSDCTKKVFKGNVPVRESIADLEPGFYVGNVLDTICCNMCFTVKCGGCSGYHYVSVCACPIFSESKKWGTSANPTFTCVDSNGIDTAYVCMYLCINKTCFPNAEYACCYNSSTEKWECVDYKTYATEWATNFWNNVMNQDITSKTVQLQ